MFSMEFALLSWGHLFKSRLAKPEVKAKMKANFHWSAGSVNLERIHRTCKEVQFTL